MFFLLLMFKKEKEKIWNNLPVKGKWLSLYQTLLLLLLRNVF